jgi:hypothetical protein
MLFVLIALPVSLAGCGKDGQSAVGHVPAARAAGPNIRVVVEDGCPRTLGRARDVENRPEGLATRLVPEGAEPVAGLVCEYTGSPTAKTPLATKLARRVPLDAHQAARLAVATGHVSVAPAHGTTSCPNPQLGSEAIIAFAYDTGRIVDLWYETSGCQTLDNGYVLAFQGGNPSFYSGFQPVFDELAPLPKQ